MFKVGDKVKIANKEKLNRYSWVNPIMLKYAGSIATITKIRDYGIVYLDIDNENWLWRNPALYPYPPIDTSQFKVIFKCDTITCYKKSDIMIYEMLGIADKLIFKNGKFIETEYDTLCKELK